MGNNIATSYHINNNRIKADKSRKKNINNTNRLLQQFGCSKMYKRRSKEESASLRIVSSDISDNECEVNINRYSVGHCENIFESFNNTDCHKIGESLHQKMHTINPSDNIPEKSSRPDCCETPKSELSGNQECLDSYKTYLIKRKRYISSPRSSMDHFDLSNYPDKVHNTTVRRDSHLLHNDSMTEPPSKIGGAYPRFSEISLNSDDLMLSTDVNLDQADDDVSKDYNATEKDDPFISELVNITDPEVNDPIHVEDSERNDVVCFDSSRESSVSLQRKMESRKHILRPHSFSTPLSTESKMKSRHSSTLSTVDSMDMAWTWMSASESANIVQELSNLKLMLLKTRRLLLDDFNKETYVSASTVNENDSSVFSEPSTPIYYNDQQSYAQSLTDWSNMDKESLIRELSAMSERNHSLQCRLHDKNRVIELLQNGGRRFQRRHPRTVPILSGIARSSTFDSPGLTNAFSPYDDSPSYQTTFSTNDKSFKSDSRNVDSGLYQSSSSTESCLHQN